MWQKYKGQWHLLLNHSSDMQDGRFLETACGDQIQSKRKNQNVFNSGENCKVCIGVWHLVFTSNADAITTLKNSFDLVVLRRSLWLTRSSTLKKAIGARIRKLEKDAVRKRNCD